LEGIKRNKKHSEGVEKKLKDRIDTTQFFCPNKTCPNYGQVGPDNQIVRAGYYGNGENKTQMLKCKVCGKRFSIRRGTPLFNLKTDEETFYRTIACIAEGNGLRATARIMGLDKDTVRRWLEKAYQHTKKVSCNGLHFKDISIDELWSFLQRRNQSASHLEVERRESICVVLRGNISVIKGQ